MKVFFNNTANKVDDSFHDDKSHLCSANFLTSLIESNVSDTIRKRVEELLKDPIIASNLSTDSINLIVNGLSSESIITRGVAFGQLKNSAPEIVYSDLSKQEIFEAERSKVALRSIEHAQPGRSFNDFRGQLSICISSLLNVPSMLIPPRARTLGLVSCLYGIILFDTFHQHIEQPFIFLPTKDSLEPKDFSEGIALFKRILPSVVLFEQSVDILWKISKSSGSDIDQELLGDLIDKMVLDLASIQKEFDLSAFSEKFRPGSLEYTALQAQEVAIWIAEQTCDLEERDTLLNYVDECTSRYASILESRAKRIEPDSLFDNRRQEAYIELNRVAKVFREVATTVQSARDLPLLDNALPINQDELDFLSDVLLEAPAKSSLARSIALDRIQFALGEMELGEINLSSIISSLKEQVLPSEGKETLVIQIPQDYDIIAIGNERRIRGALSNIISNAFHYGDTLRVTLSYDKEQEEAVIELTDNGKGVSQELLDPGLLPNRARIFDLGVTKREHDSADKKKGTGVGTTESLYVFEMHDGSLEVSSILAPNPNHGTTFTGRLKAQIKAKEEVGLPQKLFIQQVSTLEGEIVASIISDVLDTLSKEQSELLQNARFLLTKGEQDSLNQSFSVFYEERKNQNITDSILIRVPQELLKTQDQGALKILFRDFLIPFEIDAHNPSIAGQTDPLIRHTVHILRAMERFRGSDRFSKIALIEALRLVSTTNNTGYQFSNMLLESSYESETLPKRAQRALNWASSHQLRPLALRDTVSLQRESLRVLEESGAILKQEALAKEAFSVMNEKLDVLCKEFDVHSGTPLYKFILESVIEDKEIPLRPAHRMRYPLDSHSMLFYLIEHGSLGAVLRRLDVNEISRWHNLTDKVLPLAARVMKPESHELFERLLHADNADRVLAADLAQLPLLSVKTLDRMERVGDYLLNEGVKPLTADEITAEDMKVISEWSELLISVASLITDTGIDDAVYEMAGRALTDEDQKAVSLIMDHMTSAVQFQHIRAVLEARRVIESVAGILEAIKNSKLIDWSIVNKEVFFERLEILNSYTKERSFFVEDPLQDGVVIDSIRRIQSISY